MKSLKSTLVIVFGFLAIHAGADQPLQIGQDGRGENGAKPKTYADSIPARRVVVNGLTISTILRCNSRFDKITEKDLVPLGVTAEIRECTSGCSSETFDFDLYVKANEPTLTLIKETNSKIRKVVSFDLFYQAFANELDKFWHIARFFAAQQEWSYSTHIPKQEFGSVLSDNALLEGGLRNDTETYLPLLTERPLEFFSTCGAGVEKLQLLDKYFPSDTKAIAQVFLKKPQEVVRPTLPLFERMAEIVSEAQRMALGSPEFVKLQAEYLQIWKQYDYGRTYTNLGNTATNGYYKLTDVLNNGKNLFGIK